MLYYPDREGTEAHDRHHALLTEAEEWRLASIANPPRPSPVRHSARFIGRALVALGARMLRYGRAEGAILIELHQPGTRSATLN